MNSLYYYRLTDKISTEAMCDYLGLSQRDNVRSRSSLCAELIVRLLASQMLGVGTSGIALAVGAKGKPYILGVQGFHFNISHSADRVLVGIAEAEIGLDIEVFRPLNERLISRCLSVAEIAQLSKTPEARMQEFIKLWTKKEAYLKYRSCGITGSLSELEVGTPEISAHMKTFKKDGAYISLFCTGVAPEDFSFIELSDSDIVRSVDQAAELVPA